MASKSIQITPNISPISRIPNLPSVPKHATTPKKKESKSEKSLETTLEKLTQNRHKELNNRTESNEEVKPNSESTTKPDSTGKASDSRTEIADARNQTTVSPTNNNNAELKTSTDPTVSTNPPAISLPNKDVVKSESPPRTVTGSDNKVAESGIDTLKTSESTVKNVDGNSGSKPPLSSSSSLSPMERNNDLSDNKISEKIVEGGE